MDAAEAFKECGELLKRRAPAAVVREATPVDIDSGRARLMSSLEAEVAIQNLITACEESTTFVSPMYAFSHISNLTKMLHDMRNTRLEANSTKAQSSITNFLPPQPQDSYFFPFPSLFFCNFRFTVTDKNDTYCYCYYENDVL